MPNPFSSTTMMTTAVCERPILFSGAMVRAILDGKKTQTRRILKFPDAIRSIEGGDVLTTLDRMQEGYADGPRPVFDFDGEPNAFSVRNPYGAVGDRLWVRETWASLVFGRDWETGHVEDWAPAENPGAGRIVFDADPHGWNDNGNSAAERGFAWRPSIFMPRWASRLTLEITSVRVERVQDISEEDAVAEGFSATPAEQWWQGYRDMGDDHLIHQQSRSAEPPEWMIEPKRMSVFDPCASTAAKEFRITWNHLNAPRGYGWDENPWVWVLEFRRVEANHV